MSALWTEAGGQAPLPWLGPALAKALTHQQGHALLVQAAPGHGALAFALALAQSRLCETPRPQGQLACGQCAGCRLMHGRAHPDIFVLLPETLRQEHQFALAHDKGDAGEEGKRKPSRQIRIDDSRAMLEWVVKTAARGQGKQVVVHPAEALNEHASSALLKTLEEPPAGTQIILSCSDPQRILPTIRSRCQLMRLEAASTEQAQAWLREGRASNADAQALLAACAGQPLQAQAWLQDGVDAALWQRIPANVAKGLWPEGLAWPSAGVLDALIKLCHDLMSLAAAGQPRFFSASALAAVGVGPEAGPASASASATPLGPSPAWPVLAVWAHQLAQRKRAIDHPWHEGLALEALLSEAQAAMAAAKLKA